MALYSTLPVFHDVYKLTLMLFQYTKDYPREYKFTLGQDMKRDSIQLVRSIYKANRSDAKKGQLEEFLEDFEVLKFEIRLSADLRLITCKQQASLAELTDKIGKQVTGWKNSSR